MFIKRDILPLSGDYATNFLSRPAGPAELEPKTGIKQLFYLKTV